jgi:hypothetical protein
MLYKPGNFKSIFQTLIGRWMVTGARLGNYLQINLDITNYHSYQLYAGLHSA